MIFANIVLVLGILALVIMVSVFALGIYANYLIKQDRWLDERPAWLAWLLDNFT